MDYLFICFFQIIGVFFNIGEHILKLGEEHKDKTPKEIIKEMWRLDWDVLSISIGILALHVVSHLAFAYYKFDFVTHPYYPAINILSGLFFGYVGQRGLYYMLGKGEKYFQKRVDEKLN